VEKSEEKAGGTKKRAVIIGSEHARGKYVLK
jgi:hypothetical protein